MSFVRLVEAEIEHAIRVLADRQAQDLFRGGSDVKIFSDGADDAEPTWVGRCGRCGWRYVTNLHWPRHSKMPGHCDRPQHGALQGYVCGGEVLRDPNSDALLAAYLVGGYDAIQDRPGQPNVHGLEAYLAPHK